MEVGYQGVHRLEFIAGVDENAGFSGGRADGAVGVGDALQNAAGGGANGDYSTTHSAAAVYLGGDLLGDAEILAVHLVLLDALHLYGAEGAESNVQSDLAVAHAHLADTLQQLLGEVQTRGGSGGRALLFRIDGLVVVLFLQLFRYVGRQGHISYLVEHLVDILIFFGIVIEPDGAVAPIHDIGDGGAEDPSEAEGGADLCPLSGADEGLPLATLQRAQEEQLHIRAGLVGLSEKPGGNDLRGIDNQHILGAQVVHDITEYPMRHGTLGAVEHHQPTAVPLGAGALGNKLLGQLVVKIRGHKVGLYSHVFNSFFIRHKHFSAWRGRQIFHII